MFWHNKGRFDKSGGVHFVTCSVVRGIDLFTQDVYRKVIIDGLSYCQEEKDLRVFGWVIMTNRVLLIVAQGEKNPLGRIIGSFKAHTSKSIRELISSRLSDQRTSWLVPTLERLGTNNPNNNDFQLWKQDGSNPVFLENAAAYSEYLNTMHAIPVLEGFVTQPEYWRWSSAIDYTGGTGLLKNLTLLTT